MLTGGRKCGRVVCNSCSPHRITIPYQYIVQPPTSNAIPSDSISYSRFLDPNGEGHTTSSLEFGGGERVRLCNPCVPDPNIAPPQINQTGPPIQTSDTRHRPQRYHGRSASSSVATSPVSGPSVARPTSTSFGTGDERINIQEILQNYPRRPHPSSATRRSTNESTRRANQALQNWYLQDIQNSRSRSSTVG